MPLKPNYDNISNIIQGLKSYTTGGGNMALGLRAWSALIEDVHSIPSTHMVVYNHL